MPWSKRNSAEAENAIMDLEKMIGSPRSENVTQRTPPQSEMTPSPTLPDWQPKEVAKEPPKPTMRPTAYLDGLKGFACLLVYSLHYEGWTHDGMMNGDFSLEKAFGVDGNYHFVCLPIVRLLFSGGHYGVIIFFAISGYVLSGSVLRLIHEGEHLRLSKNVSSALFRRWLRLFLPVAGVTFLWFTSWHLFGIRPSTGMMPERTWYDECWKWYYNFKNYSFIFTGNADNYYSQHLWSIPMEFQGSIVVYTSLLAFSTFTWQKRVVCEFILVFYFIYVVDGWAYAVFTMGALLCDLDMLAAKGQLPAICWRLKRYETWLVYSALFASLYLGGVPSLNGQTIEDLRKAPGWYYLSFLHPQAMLDWRWHYRFYAALFAMIAVPRIPWLKRFFETSFCQYMGRICFGFYLVHGPLLWTVGDRLYAATGRVLDRQALVIPEWINAFPFPSWGPFGLEINYLVVHLIMLPLTILVADAVTKLIDEPSVKFAKWVFDSDFGFKPAKEEKQGKWAP